MGKQEGQYKDFAILNGSSLISPLTIPVVFGRVYHNFSLLSRRIYKKYVILWMNRNIDERG